MKSRKIKGFIIDCDIFQSKKVFPVINKYGTEVERIIIHTLFLLYSSNNGYYLEMNDDTVQSIASFCQYKKDKYPFVETVIDALVEHSFFNKNIYWEQSVITSEEVQRRWKLAAWRRTIEHDRLPFWIEASETEAHPELLRYLEKCFKSRYKAIFPEGVLKGIDKKIPSLSGYLGAHGGSEKVLFLTAIRRMQDYEFTQPTRYFFRGVFGEDRYLLRPTPQEEESGSYVDVIMKSSGQKKPQGTPMPKLNRVTGGSDE